MTTLKEKMDSLPTALRREVEVLAKELIAEELSRRNPQTPRGQVQGHIADKLEINHENGSSPRTAQASADRLTTSPGG